MSFLARIRFAPFFTQLVVVRRCNLACAYCNEYDKTSEPIALDILKNRLQKLKELGSYSVCLTGGEPLLHPDLPAAIRYARQDLRFLQVAMITNGFLLTPEIIQNLNEAGLQALQISIDGVVPNDVSVKVLSGLRKKLEMLREAARFAVTVSAVYGAGPPGETEEVLRVAQTLGFKTRALFLHGPDGQIRLSADQMASFERVEKTLPWNVTDFGNRQFQKRLLKNEPASFKCRSGSRYLYVDEAGVVRWCSQTKTLFGKSLADYTPADLREQFYAKKPCATSCTLGCVRSASALDTWRAQMA